MYTKFANTPGRQDIFHYLPDDRLATSHEGLSFFRRRYGAAGAVLESLFPSTCNTFLLLQECLRSTQRSAAFDAIMKLRRQLIKEHAEKTAALGSHPLLTAIRSIEDSAKESAQREIEVGIGHYRFFHQLGCFVETTFDLDVDLTRTDMTDSLRARDFRLPYPNVHLRFNRGCSGFQFTSAKAVLDAGIQSFIHGFIFSTDLGNVGQIAVTPLVTRTHGSQRIHGVTYQFPLDLRDPDRPLADVIASGLAIASLNAAGNEDIPATGEGLHHAVKCFLFMASREARTKQLTEASEISHDLKALKERKRRRLAERARAAYDSIEISYVRETAIEGDAGNEGKAERAAHWRRGHLRAQAYGQAMQERKVIWIRPVYVSGERPDTGAHQHYVLSP